MPTPPTTDTARNVDPHDEADRLWLATVYQGDTVRQLSVRSLVSGMLIGAVMSISNLYVGLKTGWGLGVTITACIIAYAVFKALETIIPAYRRNPFTILENYTMSSAASAAGFMATSGLVSSIPALYMTTGRELTPWEMMSWLAAVSVLGVFMAVPLKRQLINIEKLPFPSGIATAETLKSMHMASNEAMAKARSLFAAGIVGAVVAFWREAVPAISEWLQKRPKFESFGNRLSDILLPSEFPLVPGRWGRETLDQLTLGFEGSLMMIGAGAIMGIRVGASLLLGAVIFYGVLGPILIEKGWAAGPGYTDLVKWTLWPATAMMVTSSLLSLALRWRTMLRAFSGLTAIFGRKSSRQDPLAHIEVPGSWFVFGTLISGAACVVLGHQFFGIIWWTGIVAVAFTFLLSVVAARATGETDLTPISAMGKITQLLFGVLMPADKTANLMAASITAGASAHSADLLTDLKCGYLLGGNPRKQTISQLFGVLAGTLVCVPVYAIVVDPDKLGTTDLPAPTAKVWASVAELLSQGIDKLPTYSVTAIIIGACIGMVLTLLEEFAPAKYRIWIPSPTSVGIAGVIPAFNSVSMFLGALIAWIVAKSSPKTDEMYTIPVSSGLIAGESLMGVGVRLWQEAPGMIAKIFGHG